MLTSSPVRPRILFSITSFISNPMMTQPICKGARSGTAKESYVWSSTVTGAWPDRELSIIRARSDSYSGWTLSVAAIRRPSRSRYAARSAPTRLLWFSRTERIVSESPPAAASFRPKSAASTSILVLSCWLRALRYSDTTAPPMASDSRARLSTSASTVCITANRVTAWATASGPMVSISNLLRKLV